MSHEHADGVPEGSWAWSWLRFPVLARSMWSHQEIYQMTGKGVQRSFAASSHGSPPATLRGRKL